MTCAAPFNVSHANKIPDQATYIMKRWARNLDFFVWFSYICLYEYFAFSYLVVTCAAPSNVSHANTIPDQAMYDYLANITYTCNTGYEHSSGDLNRTCTAIDTWSGTAPACTSMWQYLGTRLTKGALQQSALFEQFGKILRLEYLWLCLKVSLVLFSSGLIAKFHCIWFQIVKNSNIFYIVFKYVLFMSNA